MREAQNNAGNMRHIFGVSPNGKAWDFGSHIAGSNPATLVWQKCHVRWHTQILLPTSGMLIKGPSQGPVGFNRAFIPLCSIVSKDIKIRVCVVVIHVK